MEMPWFIWNGADSRAMGVTLAEFPAVGAAPEEVLEAAVPGRPDTLTLAGTASPGRSRLEMRLLVTPSGDPAAVRAWLRGSGTLILGTEPDRMMTARVSGAVRFRPVGGGWHAGTALLLAQPGRAQVPPEARPGPARGGHRGHGAPHGGL